jgi:hypothetical protein
MVGLGFVLLVGLMATFALGCWLDRPSATGARLEPLDRREEAA